MPIVIAAPDAESPIQPVIPLITDPKFDGVVVDSYYQPLDGIIQHVSGFRWCVDYYSQVVAADNNLRPQDMGQSAVYQQYKEIKGLELIVDTPLSDSQDSETNRITVSGSGNILGFLIPNFGDMFAADIGDGRKGILTITSVSRNTSLKGSTYRVDYVLTYIASEHPAQYQDLVDKVIDTLYYEPGLLEHGANPIIIESEFNILRNLRQSFSNIAKSFCNTFYAQEFQTFLVPGQTSYTYDHFVTSAILSVLTTRDAPELNFIRRLNVGDDRYMKLPNIYTILLSQNKFDLSRCNKTMGVVSTTAFSSYGYFDSIRYTGIAKTVYMTNIDNVVNIPNIGYEKTASSSYDTPALPASNTMDESVTINGTVTKLINPMSFAPYVVSESFYETQTPTSIFESIILNILNKQQTNITNVDKLVNAYNGWGMLEKFYYTPILLMIIRYTLERSFAR